MKVEWKKIKIYEPRTWGRFRIGWQVSKEKQSWSDDEMCLLKLLSLFERKGKLREKLTKTKKKQMYNAMALSHKNQRIAFESRGMIQTAEVADVDKFIEYLVL